MSGPTAFRIGESFDPREAQTGKLYPVDWVNGNQDLNDGPKRVYCYLYGIAVKSNRAEFPWRGFVYPTVEEIARNLGKSSPSVRRDLAVLQTQKYLRSDRPNKRECNRYFFLWKKEFERPWRPSYERSNLSAQERKDERSNLKSSALESEHPERSNMSAPYKEDSQFYSQGIPTSSSRSDGGDYTRDREPTELQKTKKIPPYSKSENADTRETPWYEIGDALEQSHVIIENSFVEYHPVRRVPLDLPTVLNIVHHMAGLDDLRLWIGTSAGTHAAAKTWGWLVNDAQKWPARRRITLAVVERSVPAPPPVQDWRDAEPTRSAAKPAPPPQPAACGECGGGGIRFSKQNDLYEWCTCREATLLRATRPDEVDRSNASWRKLQKFQKKPGNEIDIPTPAARGSAHKGMRQARDLIPIAAVATAGGGR